MAGLTLLDIAKRNGSDQLVGLIDETTKLIPEISGLNYDGSKIPNVGSARTIKGQQYKTRIRTNLPTVGFRDANEGVVASASTYENRLVETFFLNPRWECDKMVADSSEDGAEAVIAEEAAAITQAAMQLLGAQFFYGRSGNDGKGHPGLIDSIQTAYTYDRAGTGSACGSVYGVKFGPKDVTWVWGQDGQMSVSDVRIGDVIPDATKPTAKFTAYIQEIMAHVGVQVGSLFSLGRVKNVTAAATLRDSDIFKMLSLMKVRPDVLFMNKTLLEQLRSSRTATNPTGAPAPRPTEVDGIPIAPTESLTMTEVAA